MNANELADELDFIFEMINDKFPRANIFKMTEAATMLRQLQAENEELKHEHENLKRAYLILSGSLSNVTGGGK